MADITELKQTDRLIDSWKTINDNFGKLNADIGDTSSDLATTDSNLQALASTSEIVASGDKYVRFANGLQICWGQEVLTLEGSNTRNFPVAFSEQPTISLNFNDNVQATQYLSADNRNTTSFHITVYSNAYPCRIGYIAIGRWK